MNRVCVSAFVCFSYSVALFAGTSGCGDNFQAKDDASVGDSASGMPIAIAVAPSADYTAPGILSKLDVVQRTSQTNLAAGAVGGDPMLRRIGDTLYIINRNLNNVTMLSAHGLSYVDQISTGNNSNPQDVAVVGDQLFIPALGTAGIVVGMRGSNEPTTIDLQDDLNCADTCKPYCVSAYAIDNEVYVACGLFTFTEAAPFGAPAEKGKVAVIDATSHAVRTVFELPGPNPYNQFVRTPVNSAFGGDLLIPTLDFVVPTNSTIVRVSPGTSPSASLAIPSTDLQGSASHIDVFEGQPSLLFMAVAPNFDEGQLRVFDLSSNQLWSGSLSPSTQYISDVAACPDGSIVVADRSGSGGLRVYSSGGAEVTSTALSIGLQPGFGNQLVCYTP